MNTSSYGVLDHRPYPCIVQSPQYSCEESAIYRYLLGYGFFPIFCTAMVGNILNLFIYNSARIRFFLAIRMLCTKLLMNTLTMLCLLPNALRLLHVWTIHSPVDFYYWKIWPYTSFLGNVFGFCAMWLTVMMIGECYMHIFYPSRSKDIFSHINLRRMNLILLVTGGALALIYPVNRHAKMLHTLCNKTVIVIAPLSNVWYIGWWELAHTVGNLVVALIVPLTLLVFMTVAIFWKMKWNANENTRNRFSSEKRTVTRLTLITTALQLSETPSVLVFLYVAIRGPSGMHGSVMMCGLQTVSIFLGLCHMSMSFFVYLAFSPRFRAMFKSQFLDICGFSVGDVPRTSAGATSRVKADGSSTVEFSAFLHPSHADGHLGASDNESSF